VRRERERKRERKREREKEREKKREREKERERTKLIKNVPSLWSSERVFTRKLLRSFFADGLLKAKT